MKKNIVYEPLAHAVPFSTYDLGCSAALMSLGYKLLNLERGGSAKALFLFEESDGLMRSADLYWRGELQVDALAYFHAIKNLKNQLYSSRYAY